MKRSRDLKQFQYENSFLVKRTDTRNHHMFVISHIQRIGCQPETNYFITRWSIPLAVTRRIHIYRRYASRRYAGGLGPSRIRTRIPTTRQLGQWVSLRKTLRFRVRLQFSQSRCLSLLLAMSGRVFLFLPPRGHEPPPTPRDRLNPKPQPLPPSFPNPPLCQTPGCRSVHSRSILPPSRPVLYALRPQGFQT